MPNETKASDTTADQADPVDALVMQRWITTSRGRVLGGKYDGSLLRAGVCDGPYIDILMPGDGWNTLASDFIRNDKDLRKLEGLKIEVDKWLSA